MHQQIVIHTEESCQQLSTPKITLVDILIKRNANKAVQMSERCKVTAFEFW